MTNMQTTKDAAGQVGGDHYTTNGIDHMDLMEQWDIPNMESCATKYTFRIYRKGIPLLDIEKAITYVRRLIATGRGARRLIPYGVLEAWLSENAHLNSAQRGIFICLLNPADRRDYVTALEMLERERQIVQDTGA